MLLQRSKERCYGNADDITIGSVSLGAERWFELRPKPGKWCQPPEAPGATPTIVRPGRKRHRIRLKSGSLLVMAGATQRHWQHALPADSACDSVRINLTFRHVHVEDKRGQQGKRAA